LTGAPCDRSSAAAALGIAPDSDRTVIRAAFLLKALEQHPDRGGTTAAMARINASYAVLLDPARRAALDRAADTGSGGRPSRASSRPQGPIPRPVGGRETPAKPAARPDPRRRTRRSPQLGSRWGQWLATLVAFGALALVGLLGGTGAVLLSAALLATLAIADRRPVGIPFWPAADMRAAVEFVVRRALRLR
jgi:hypothetical protein